MGRTWNDLRNMDWQNRRRILSLINSWQREETDTLWHSKAELPFYGWKYCGDGPYKILLHEVLESKAKYYVQGQNLGMSVIGISEVVDIQVHDMSSPVWHVPLSEFDIDKVPKHVDRHNLRVRALYLVRVNDCEHHADDDLTLELLKWFDGDRNGPMPRKGD